MHSVLFVAVKSVSNILEFVGNSVLFDQLFWFGAFHVVFLQKLCGDALIYCVPVLRRRFDSLFFVFHANMCFSSAPGGHHKYLHT